MAKAASTNVVQADMKPPNYRGAVKLIRSTKPIKDQMSGLAGKVSKVFAQCSGDMKVNSKGAKIFYSLDNMTEDERSDVLRTVRGMIEASDWPEEGTDLVDQAEGNVHHLNINGRSAGPDDNEDEDEDDLDLEEEEGEDGVDINDALRVQEAIDKAPKLNAGDFEEATPEELAAQAGRKDSVRDKLDAGTGTTDEAE